MMAFTLFLFSNVTMGYDEVGTWTYVKRIFVPASGGSIYVYFEGESLPGCHTNNGAYIPSSNIEGANRVHSTLLAALMAKRKVQVFYNYNSDDQQSWSRCNIAHVYVQ